MERSSAKNYFRWWLALYLSVLLIQATSFLLALYFLSESVRDGNRWIAFGIIALVNIFAFIVLHVLNNKMSVGSLGSFMQPLRTSRFPNAFFTVIIATLLSVAFTYFIDEVIYPSPTPLSYGALAAGTVFLGGIFEFIFVYYLFQGQGITRL